MVMILTHTLLHKVILIHTNATAFRCSMRQSSQQCDAAAPIHPYECGPTVCEHLFVAQTITGAHTGKAKTCVLPKNSCYTHFLRVETSHAWQFCIHATKSRLFLIFNTLCMCRCTRTNSFQLVHTHRMLLINTQLGCSSYTAHCVLAYLRRADVLNQTMIALFFILLMQNI